MIRLAALFIVIGVILAAGPAAAQFGNIFGNTPPLPPADVPGGSFPPQPSARDYPEQAQPVYPSQTPQTYPGQAAPAYSAAPAPSSAVQSQPLPPPPGATEAPIQPPGQPYPQQPALPAERTLAAPPPANSPPGNPQASPPTAAESPSIDDTVVEKPTAHIANKEAVFVGLDKVTGRTIKFDAAIGETVQFGALQVTPRACYTRPPTEATNTDAFVEVDEVTLKGQIKRIFTGWMFASSPGLNAVEHPIYDVWLIDCDSPIETTLAEPAAQTAPERPRGAAPLRRNAPSAQ
jgi:hypothetical protein